MQAFRLPTPALPVKEPPPLNRGSSEATGSGRGSSEETGPNRASSHPGGLRMKKLAIGRMSQNKPARARMSKNKFACECGSLREFARVCASLRPMGGKRFVRRDRCADRLAVKPSGRQRERCPWSDPAKSFVPPSFFAASQRSVREREMARRIVEVCECGSLREFALVCARKFEHVRVILGRFCPSSDDIDDDPAALARNLASAHRLAYISSPRFCARKPVSDKGLQSHQNVRTAGCFRPTQRCATRIYKKFMLN